jgi:hypothetical protein
MAGGSALWGVVAQAFGLRDALLTAAAALLVSLLAVRRWPLGAASATTPVEAV